MPVGSVNYTGRKRIFRRDAEIHLREINATDFSFTVNLNLGRYDLPNESRVVVDAYRQTHFERFDLGTVGNISRQEYYPHTLRSADGILFRVKVIAVNDNGGLLLAEADRLRPRRRELDEGDHIPLLSVVSDTDLDMEMWRLDFDADQVLLRINSDSDWKLIAKDISFQTLVYPAIFRSVLWYICFRERYLELDDLDDWKARWLKFATSLPGGANLPSLDDEEETERWIDNTVGSFCRAHKIRTTFLEYWNEAEA